MDRKNKAAPGASGQEEAPPPGAEQAPAPGPRPRRKPREAGEAAPPAAEGKETPAAAANRGIGNLTGVKSTLTGALSKLRPGATDAKARPAGTGEGEEPAEKPARERPARERPARERPARERPAPAPTGERPAPAPAGEERPAASGNGPPPPEPPKPALGRGWRVLPGSPRRATVGFTAAEAGVPALMIGFGGGREDRMDVDCRIEPPAGAARIALRAQAVTTDRAPVTLTTALTTEQERPWLELPPRQLEQGLWQELSFELGGLDAQKLARVDRLHLSITTPADEGFLLISELRVTA